MEVLLPQKKKKKRDLWGLEVWDYENLTLHPFVIEEQKA